MGVMHLYQSLWHHIQIDWWCYLSWLCVYMCTRHTNIKCIVNIILLWMQSTVMWMNQISALFFLTDWALVHFYILFLHFSCVVTAAAPCDCILYGSSHSYFFLLPSFQQQQQQIQFHDKDVPPIYTYIHMWKRKKNRILLLDGLIYNEIELKFHS